MFELRMCASKRLPTQHDVCLLLEFPLILGQTILLTYVVDNIGHNNIWRRVGVILQSVFSKLKEVNEVCCAASRFDNSARWRIK